MIHGIIHCLKKNFLLSQCIKYKIRTIRSVRDTDDQFNRLVVGIYNTIFFYLLYRPKVYFEVIDNNIRLLYVYLPIQGYYGNDTSCMESTIEDFLKLFLLEILGEDTVILVYCFYPFFYLLES